MKPIVVKFFRVVAAALACALLMVPAAAQDYPNRPVKLVVPYPAGSGPDQLARVLAQVLQSALGGSVIVDNKAGALGVIGTTEVARSKPDGYTLLLTTNTTQAANVALVKNLGYDPVKDFAPVSRVTVTPMVLLVNPSLPARDLASFVALAKSRPEGFSGGYGSAASLVSMAKLKAMAGFPAIDVPYKGIPLAVNDLLGGQISFTFADLPVGMPQIQGGKLRGIAVTSLKRAANDPSLPAIAELYPGFEVIGWQGVVAPAGTPPAIVKTLADAIAAGVAKPEVHDKLVAMHHGVSVLGPDAFAAFIDSEIRKWKKDATDAGLEAQ